MRTFWPLSVINSLSPASVDIPLREIEIVFIGSSDVRNAALVTPDGNARAQSGDWRSFVTDGRSCRSPGGEGQGLKKEEQ